MYWGSFWVPATMGTESNNQVSSFNNDHDFLSTEAVHAASAASPSHLAEAPVSSQEAMDTGQMPCVHGICMDTGLPNEQASTLPMKFSSCARDLQISNVTSPNSAQLVITWVSSGNSVSYFLLDLRVINNSTIPPVSSYVTQVSRSKLIQGLRAGTSYNVTLKSFSTNNTMTSMLESVWLQARTVPAAPQIIQSNGVSCSEILVSWTSQIGADYYLLAVHQGNTSLNYSFTAITGNVMALQPSTFYNLTVYAANSAGFSSASKYMTVLTLTSPPAKIITSALSSYAVNLTWTAVDKAVTYGVFIYENGNVNNPPIIRKTTATTVVLGSLMPCTIYIFGLVSFNWYNNAGEENRIQVETGKLDPVQNVVAQYTNNVQSAIISWKGSTGATSYTATAMNPQGHVVFCSSSNTSCEITGLQCERTYAVNVLAKTDSCTSTVNETLALETVPCAPENVTAVRDCYINTVTLYWNPALGAIEYTSMAFTPDGGKEECFSHDTVCYFINLQCGTEYKMSVYAFNGKKNSSSSQPIKIKTAPCDPQDVQTVSDCGDNTLTITWMEALGALSYIATVQGSSGSIYNCTSFRPSCAIAGVHCGESLSVYVIAFDDDCPSGRSLSAEATTAPCTPHKVLAVVDCNSATTHVQWERSDGAIQYMVAAEASDGSQYSCESFDQRCLLTDLPCGLLYSVSVTAMNDKCNSNASSVVEFQTVPCSIENIRGDLDCDHNNLQATWQEGLGNLTYTAVVEENGSPVASCLTQNNYCEISSINCGRLYVLSVTANSGQCSSLRNDTVEFKSAR
ncbi:fibronectin type III domain-containing protein 7-like [Rhinatrema bivittatum]|uniref:fibronectin type III domain-containing protein 7-like n=1 Tax=Rhinatrema bivittatum TaxID=194408 RepID=UPI00112A1166|nr:fibronectin type III domain-containing protein 7-like [Rhinatrema bivittatum]